MVYSREMGRRVRIYVYFRPILGLFHPAKIGLSESAGIRTIAKACGLPAPIDIYSLFQKHCPITAGTPGHAANSTDQVCDWVVSALPQSSLVGGSVDGNLLRAVIICIFA